MCVVVQCGYMYHTSKSKGFTLIELLVVIAIIGIIMAVAFGYLALSRNKGSDAGIQQNMVNARTQAEVYFANNGNSYEGVCEDDNRLKIGKHLNAAAKAYGKEPEETYAGGSAWNREACYDSETAYAAWVPLKGSTSQSPLGLCIDSNNATREVSSPLTSGSTACPAS